MRSIEDQRILLFSGGQSEPKRPYFHYADDWLPAYLQKNLPVNPSVMYIPWAVWGQNTPDDMFRFGQEHWGRLDIGIEPLHRQKSMINAIEKSDAIIVGGGSIHMLVKSLVNNRLLEPIKARVMSGAVYIGESAGSVIASPTRLTALEPALIHLAQTRTLHLVPFQVTPHYYDVDNATHHSGPPPSARIRNYISFNRTSYPVLAIKDGSWIELHGDSINLHGEKTARIFNRDLTDERVKSGDDLSSLLNVRSRHFQQKLR